MRTTRIAHRECKEGKGISPRFSPWLKMQDKYEFKEATPLENCQVYVPNWIVPFRH